MTVLLRHAETAWNRDGIGYGHTDIPLSAEGHAAAWQYKLPYGITRILTSPLARAYETAAVIAHRHSLPTPTVLPALIERHHGDGEGVRKTDLPDVVHGRESDDSIRARAIPILAHLNNRCLIVTHAGVIRALTGERVTHLETAHYP